MFGCATLLACSRRGVATTVSGIGGAVTYRLMRGPSAPMFDTWQHWFASDFVGIIAVAPLVVGLAAVVRRPSPRSEVIEGTLGLLALALVTGLIISLPRVLWETVFPITWLFPVLVWLAARGRPAFSAAGAFLVSVTIVLTTILGIGHFGDPSHPINDRILGCPSGHSGCDAQRIRTCRDICPAEGECGKPRSLKHDAGARARQ